PGIAGPIFAAVDDVLALLEFSSKSYADGRGLRCVEIGRAAWSARRLTHHPSGQIFALRVIACRLEPFLLLGLSAEPHHVHETQAVDQDRGGEARVDGTDLLGHQLEI